MKTEIEHCKHFDISKDEKSEVTCIKAICAENTKDDGFCYRCHMGCVKIDNCGKLNDCYED